MSSTKFPIQPKTVATEQVKNILDLASEWAAAVGIQPKERIEFASEVKAFCLRSTTPVAAINFGVHFNESGTYFLHALSNDMTIAEKVIPVKIGKNGIPLLKHAPNLHALLQKNKELEQNNQDLKQFSFAIAHDLKNSLTKLKLAISLLEEEVIPPGMLRYIQIIDRSARQLEQTTLSLNELIELGHSGKGIVKNISLGQVFSGVSKEFEESLTAVNASVKTNFSSADHLPYIEIYLKSIFSNLISNSVKYASPDRALEINVSAHTEGEKVVIDYTDNGQGIDLVKHTRDQLFQPFTRFSENTQGKGLGLYIVKTMVERNGGGVKVESAPNEGATFHFILQPYQPDEHE